MIMGGEFQTEALLALLGDETVPLNMPSGPH